MSVMPSSSVIWPGWSPGIAPQPRPFRTHREVDAADCSSRRATVDACLLRGRAAPVRGRGFEAHSGSSGGAAISILFTALAEGRLHLTAVWLLAPHLTPKNAEELIQAANHKRKFRDRRATCPSLRTSRITPACVRPVQQRLPICCNMPQSRLGTSLRHSSAHRMNMPRAC